MIFFAVLRSCYNRRSDRPTLQRLSFVLLGVAAPARLIQDKTRTPFNIGHAIDLTGFQPGEIGPLQAGWDCDRALADRLGAVVLSWTGGQPFLTQKVCQWVAQALPQEPEDQDPEAWVAQLIQARLLDNWENQDEPQHLRTIRDRLLLNEAKAVKLLGLYEQILIQGSIQVDDSVEQMELRLSGLVVQRWGQLRVYNRIYARVFDRAWVRESLAHLRPGFYGQALGRWLAQPEGDPGALLQGQDLQRAQQWSAGKQLSIGDYRFLAACQEAEVQRILARAEQQAKWTVYRGFSTLLAMAAMAVMGVLWSGYAVQQAQQVTEIERQTQQALQQFELKQLESLLLATRSARTLAELFEADRPPAAYPTLSPFLALQQILSRVREQNQIRGHQGPVGAVAFSPDGQRVLTGSEDGTAKIWTVQGQLVAELQVSPGGGTAVGDPVKGGFNERGFDRSRSAASEFAESESAESGSAASESAESGSTESGSTTSGSAASGSAASGSAASGSAASGSAAGSSATSGAVEDAAANPSAAVTASPLARLRYTSPSLSAAINPDLGPGISPGGIGTDTNIDPAGRTPPNPKLAQPQPPIVAVAYAPDGSQVAIARGPIADTPGQIQFWTAQGQPIAQLAVPGTITDMAFRPDSQDAPGGTSLALITQQGHLFLASSTVAALQPLTAVCDVEFCDFRTDFGTDFGTNLDISQSQETIDRVAFTKLAWSAAGQGLAVGAADGTVTVWRAVGTAGSQSASRSGLGPVSLEKSGAESGSELGAASRGQLRVWRTWEAHRGAVEALAWTGEGADVVLGQGSAAEAWGHALLATGGTDGSIKLWTPSGQAVRTLSGHQSPVLDLAFDPTGATLGSASADRTVRIWHRSGQTLAILQGHQDRVEALQFQPVTATATTPPSSLLSPLLVTASQDHTVRLWNLEPKGPVQTFKAAEGSVLAVQFTPDGQGLVTAGSDRQGWGWDRQGQAQIPLWGHGGPVWDVRVSPQGRYWVTASGDGTARLWTAEGQLLQVLTGHQGEVLGAAIDPTEQFVATASGDGTAVEPGGADGGGAGGAPKSGVGCGL